MNKEIKTVNAEMTVLIVKNKEIKGLIKWYMFKDQSLVSTTSYPVSVSWLIYVISNCSIHIRIFFNNLVFSSALRLR